MRNRPRPAFSLFELLVVIAIIAFLLALLLPAVQKVRSAANRMKSQNNLKQLGISCLGYIDSNGTFPPGNDANNFSAAAKILPYVEQDNLYKTIHFDKPVDDQANAEARKVMVAVFLNPEDPLIRVTEDSGATNYLFNAGSKFDLNDNDGVFYQDSKVRFADIQDGTSNTLLAGETLKGDGGTKARTNHRQHVLLKKADLKDLKEDSGVADWQANRNIGGDRCASWMDGRFLQGTCTGTRLINDPRPDVSCDGAGGLSGFRTETTGVNMSLCDGSVRFVSQGVSAELLKLLSSRADGQPLPAGF